MVAERLRRRTLRRPRDELAWREPRLPQEPRGATVPEQSAAAGPTDVSWSNGTGLKQMIRLLPGW